MKLLVVFSHPSQDSYNAAVRDTVVEVLRGRGDDVRMLDLYAIAFDPVMSKAEWNTYAEEDRNEVPRLRSPGSPVLV